METLPRNRGSLQKGRKEILTNLTHLLPEHEQHIQQTSGKKRFAALY